MYPIALIIIENVNLPCLCASLFIFSDEGQVKVVVMLRNPKDNLSAYYHFYTMDPGQCIKYIIPKYVDLTEIASCLRRWSNTSLTWDPCRVFVRS